MVTGAAAPPMRRIDSHHHLWDPVRGDYPWMPPDGPLHQAFVLDDLKACNGNESIDGTVLVQAAPTVEETLWLLDIADSSGGEILGVVGWVDLAADDVADQLDRVQHPLLVGIRPMIQDIPDDRWVLQPAVLESLDLLSERGLVLDFLGYTRHLPHALTALEKVPDLRVVIDHLAKPDYDHLDPDWVGPIRALATRPGTYMKISGMATEVDGVRTAERFQRHIDLVLEEFSPARAMLGTDWPVSTLAMKHGDTVDLLEAVSSNLAAVERADVWGGTCSRAYRLDSTDALSRS
ncbi:amidohydrolase family protein [Gordonia sp. LSe1-13]|uniref:Amidohydrolase family protein n=1 Tax=Gordonia sesuvii TaxID=3116777 RepID=A0ABU7M9A1_9ACTN|nr:amidohydrolase family protein [Gordonia sp. LSe1-13]